MENELMCDKCEHAIFDPIWGEHKCSKKQRYVKPELDADCEEFKEGAPKESKIVNDLLKDDD